MSKYQLGKDIQSLLDRMERIEQKLDRMIGDKERCLCETVVTVGVQEGKEELEIDGKLVTLAYKYVNWNPNGDDECYWRKHISKVYENGRIDDYAELYNNSSIFDPQGGDDHYTRMWVQEGDRDIAYWDWNRFVPRDKTRTKHYVSHRDAIRDQYAKIDSMTRSMYCG